jgi:hypothetical protein
MLSYVVAFATAVTISVSPFLEAKAEDAATKKPTEWTKLIANVRPTVDIADTISVNGVAKYILSVAEQDALRRALFRSAKIVDPGRIA